MKGGIHDEGGGEEIKVEAKPTKERLDHECPRWEGGDDDLC